MKWLILINYDPFEGGAIERRRGAVLEGGVAPDEGLLRAEGGAHQRRRGEKVFAADSCKVRLRRMSEKICCFVEGSFPALNRIATFSRQQPQSPQQQRRVGPPGGAGASSSPLRISSVQGSFSARGSPAAHQGMRRQQPQQQQQQQGNVNLPTGISISKASLIASYLANCVSP